MSKNTNIPQAPQWTIEEYRTYIEGLHLPRYEEIPDIDLYMDQLITYIDTALRPLLPRDEKLLTSSMVNNYVKQGIIPTPQAKRYNRNHVAYLMMMCLLKRSFSMQDMQHFIDVQVKTHELASSYNFMCTALERTLQLLFNCEEGNQEFNSLEIAEPTGCAFALSIANEKDLSHERRLALAAGTCAANKIFVEKVLEFYLPAHPEQHAE